MVMMATHLNPNIRSRSHNRLRLRQGHHPTAVATPLLQLGWSRDPGGKVLCWCGSNWRGELSCVWILHSGHIGEVCTRELILWRYERRNEELLVRSCERMRLIFLSSCSSEELISGGDCDRILLGLRDWRYSWTDAWWIDLTLCLIVSVVVWFGSLSM